jgi:hypothetical protein
MLHEYRVGKEAGVRFTGVTRDPNPIHIDDEIVPGSLTVSKVMIPLEVLLPGYRIASVRAKFTGASFYDQRTVSHFRLRPGSGHEELRAEVTTYQSGRTIAKHDISAAPRRRTPAPRRKKVLSGQNLGLIRQYFDCLNVDGRFFFDPDGPGEPEYPLGLLASLPSGEMVRQFKGQGGMLNVLSLTFPADLPAAVGDDLPEVELSQGKVRPTFNRILARITDGLKTFGKGFAVVHSQAAFSP